MADKLNTELLGTDLKLADIEMGMDLEVSGQGDLKVAQGAYNLGQAVINRLICRKGELSQLGHTNYGSRLYELVGEPNNERTRELARMYTKECLRSEPRVEKILKVSVKSVGRDRLDIFISVVPIGSEVALNIVFPFYLEVA